MVDFTGGSRGVRSAEDIRFDRERRDALDAEDRFPEICGKRNSHHPMNHPWSLTAVCQEPVDHGLGIEPTICKQRVEGFWILWWGYA
jgi:hypothetical protein